MSENDKYYSSYKMQMLIHENEKTRNNLQKQLMDGKKMVSAEDSPEEYQMVSDLEIKIDITKKSLENCDEAVCVVELLQQALMTIVSLIQMMLDVTIQARQPGISDLDLVSLITTIQGLEAEMESTLSMYTYKNQSVFYHKDRILESDQKTWEVAKRFKWNITDSILKPNYLTLVKPKIILKGLEQNFLFKEKTDDTETYCLDGITTSSPENLLKLDYNIKVIKADLKKMHTYLDDLSVFNNLLVFKRKTLISVYGTNLDLLQKLVSIDRETHKAKIDMLNCQIKTARQTFQGLSYNDPVTNTVSSILGTSTNVFKQV